MTGDVLGIIPRQRRVNASALVCLEETAYTEIKQRILDGRLTPGMRLVYRTLAKELGMSINPVVLALRMLERDGLVTNTPGLGVCVRKWAMEDVKDLYYTRGFLEALASRLCAERGTPAALDMVRAAHEVFRTSLDENDVEANIQADVQLHMAIVRGACSAELERILENLAVMRYSMRIFMFSFGIEWNMSPAARDMHVPLVEAIESRDAGRAEREGRLHVERSLEWNLSLLK